MERDCCTVAAHRGETGGRTCVAGRTQQLVVQRVVVPGGQGKGWRPASGCVSARSAQPSQGKQQLRRQQRMCMSSRVGERQRSEPTFPAPPAVWPGRQSEPPCARGSRTPPARCTGTPACTSGAHGLFSSKRVGGGCGRLCQGWHPLRVRIGAGSAGGVRLRHAPPFQASGHVLRPPYTQGEPFPRRGAHLL